jgi:hypothetical protein
LFKADEEYGTSTFCILIQKLSLYDAIQTRQEFKVPIRCIFVITVGEKKIPLFVENSNYKLTVL